jgi:hypothetical protein
MSVRKVWRIRIAGKHRVVELTHNLTDGSGAITVDGGLRQCFGARLEPSSSKCSFDVDRRECVIRIQLNGDQSYRYVCEVNGTILVADGDRSVPALTLLSASYTPSVPNGELLRPASTGDPTPANELLLPQSGSAVRSLPNRADEGDT